jgi:hypothetical protein
MNFKQLETEHVAQAWERMKSLVKNCPTHTTRKPLLQQRIYLYLNIDLGVASAYTNE